MIRITGKDATDTWARFKVLDVGARFWARMPDTNVRAALDPRPYTVCTYALAHAPHPIKVNA